MSQTASYAAVLRRQRDAAFAEYRFADAIALQLQIEHDDEEPLQIPPPPTFYPDPPAK